MKISFVLPSVVKIPMGGAKIVSIYADEFAKMGHEITLYYPQTICGAYFRQKVKLFVKPIIDKLQSVPDKLYYNSDFGVKHKIVPEISRKHISNADIIIATGWQTAKPIANLPGKHEKKIYFIQHWEPFFGKRKTIEQTYRLPLKKIVIAGWLRQKLEKMGESTIAVVPNWIIPGEFYQSIASNKREEVISFVYHHNKIKGGKDGLKILRIIKKRNPKIRIIVISTRPICNYKQNFDIRIRPNTEQIREIFNQSAIFLHTSFHEGWGLPPMEAAASGAVVIGYKNLGISEFLDEKTALLSQPGDINSVTKNIYDILENKNKRTEFVLNAQKRICDFSLEQSAQKFLDAITGDEG